MKKYCITLLIFLLVSASGKAAFSDSLRHFTGFTPTPFMIDFLGKILINNKEGNIGDEIGVFNEHGVLCGACVITKPGQYGILHVYGDDPSTYEIEGASSGNRFTFVVWDSKLDIEYIVSHDEMTPTSLGSFKDSPIPPIWTSGKNGFGLNININIK